MKALALEPMTPETRQGGTGLCDSVGSQRRGVTTARKNAPSTPAKAMSHDGPSAAYTVHTVERPHLTHTGPAHGAKRGEVSQDGVGFSGSRPRVASQSSHAFSGVPRTMQQTVSGSAHAPLLHHVDNAKTFPFGHGQHTGAQSSGSEQADPATSQTHRHIRTSNQHGIWPREPAVVTRTLNRVTITPGGRSRGASSLQRTTSPSRYREKSGPRHSSSGSN